MYSRALSHSSMGLYKECPQRFKFRYLDGIRESPKSYFSFGQSVHKALEYFYRSQLLAPVLNDVLAFYKTHWVKEGYKTAEEEKKNFDEGVRIINAFYKKHAADWKPPLATEYDFSVTVDGVSVCGKIDRIDKLPSGALHVIDYKTGKAFSPDKVTQDQQLTLYQVACEDALGAPVERLTLYHLPTLTPMDSPRHEDSLVRNLRKSILSVKTSIDAGDFTPKPDDWKCKWCDYKKICPAWNGTPPAKPALKAMPASAAKKPAAFSVARTTLLEIEAPAPRKKPDIASKIDDLTERLDQIRGELQALKRTLENTDGI